MAVADSLRSHRYQLIKLEELSLSQGLPGASAFLAT
jgi:hypothetical protein